MLDIEMMQNFLKKWEGVETVGYVPCRKKNYTGRGDPALCGPVIGASGVTVGIGVDLGQQSLEDLRSLHLSDDLLKKLSFYVGKKKDAALEALHTKKLILDDAEVDKLDDGIFCRYLTRLMKMYDLASRVPFDERPGQVQAVLMSLFYQVGSPYADHSNWQRVWKALCLGRWEEAQTRLESMQSYRARREDEAALLSQIKVA